MDSSDENSALLSPLATEEKPEKYNMRQFISATQNYSKTKAENTACLLSRYLQVREVIIIVII